MVYHSTRALSQNWFFLASFEMIRIVADWLPRVLTQDQTLNLQKDALEKAGCNKIFTDTASGAKAERKGLEEALSYVRKGNTLVVWRLDRLGRSLPHLITTMNYHDRS
jgi:DNA invertase Pin-like site-specific DNA recombinase